MTDGEIIAKAVTNIKERHKERERKEAEHVRVKRLAEEVCKHGNIPYDSAEKEVRRIIHNANLPRPTNGELLG